MNSRTSIRFTICFSVGLVVVMASQLDLQAQIPEGLNPRVTINVGSSFLRGERLFVVAGDAFQSKFESRPAIGVRGTLDLTNAWGVEGAYAFSPNTLHLTRLDNPLRERRFDLRVQRMEANVLRYITSGGVRLFLTGGIGMSRFSPSDAAMVLAATNDFIHDPAQISATTKFSGNLGGGIETRFHRWMGLRVDVRDHITNVPRFGLKETSSGPGSVFYPVTGAAHDVETSVGLVLYLR